ncbi:MAG: zf-HC2 domain-containing protein [Candidatus Zixiibacteriota bacterium]
MKTSCIDPKTGNNLHAYELGLLSDPESEIFEVHLLACDHCRRELGRFESSREYILHDADVRNMAATGDGPQLSPAMKWKKLLWPDIPIFFRPAILLGVIVLLSISTALFDNGGRQTLPGPAEEISLIQNRIGSVSTFEITGHHAILVSFVHPFGATEPSYRVVVSDQNGRILYRDEKFASFDLYSTGRIILPVTDLQSGTYKLSVQGGEKESERIEFVFRIIIRE